MSGGRFVLPWSGLGLLLVLFWVVGLLFGFWLFRTQPLPWIVVPPVVSESDSAAPGSDTGTIVVMPRASRPVAHRRGRVAPLSTSERWRLFGGPAGGAVYELPPLRFGAVVVSAEQPLARAAGGGVGGVVALRVEPRSGWRHFALGAGGGGVGRSVELRAGLLGGERRRLAARYEEPLATWGRLALRGYGEASSRTDGSGVALSGGVLARFDW